jgi:lipopolysaccharide export system protein LptA
MKRVVGTGFLLMAFLLPVLLGSAGAQSKKGETRTVDKPSKGTPAFGFSTNSQAPIDITSDTVEASQKDNTVTFNGNVIAKQEDITLYANKMVVSYNPDTKKFKEIMAVGNVRIVQLDRRATSQKASFEQDAAKVTLEGEAVLREGENVIRGERIIYYVDEQRSVVEGGKGGRVTTTISPGKKE